MFRKGWNKFAKANRTKHPGFYERMVIRMANFGKIIKDLRESRHMTQTELSKRINVTKSMISAYENDSRSPSYGVLIKIVQLFGVSVDYMFGFNNEYLSVTGLDENDKRLLSELAEALRTKEKLKRKMEEKG